MIFRSCLLRYRQGLHRTVNLQAASMNLRNPGIVDSVGMRHLRSIVNDNKIVATKGSIDVDFWLRHNDGHDEKLEIILEDTVLEHSTGWVLKLLRQDVGEDEPVTTKRCHVALYQLLYAYNPREVKQRRFRRENLVPGSASRAYNIYKAMIHHPSVTVDDQTVRLVLQILSRDHSTSDSYPRSLELVENYLSQLTQQSLQQETWMYNQVLACLANSSKWDKAYLAIKLFTETMHPNIDASSYSHILRACRSSTTEKNKKIGQKIAYQLWDKHISLSKDPKLLSPHVYTFLFQSVPNHKQHFLQILEHCCQMGKLNSHVIVEILKNKETFLSSHHSITKYIIKAEQNKPIHQQAAALFKIIPKKWSRNVTSTSSNSFGW